MDLFVRQRFSPPVDKAVVAADWCHSTWRGAFGQNSHTGTTRWLYGYDC